MKPGETFIKEYDYEFKLLSLNFRRIKLIEYLRVYFEVF